jgi:hypothetical protein
MSRIVFCLVLICLCTTASAREMRGAGSDDGSCPEIAAAVAEAEASAPATKPRAAAPAARGKSAKSSAVRGDTQRVQAPRWHSFLPGMFR